MSDISKEELKKEIAAILKGADLSSITTKKVRQDIEKKLDIDLSDRRKEVDELVMEHLDNDKGKKKKNGNVEEEEEDEEEDDDNEEEDEDASEEEEEKKKPRRSSTSKKPAAKRYKAGSASSDESEESSEGEGDDEYSPKKKKPAKKVAGKRGAGRKKKTGSDNDSDEDWGKKKKKSGAAKTGAKRANSGYTKSINLSPELAAVVGENQMPRHEVVKRMWAIIKERNLYDPKNKQFAICDDELLKVFGVKRFRTFGMMKFLKNHFRD